MEVPPDTESSRHLWPDCDTTQVEVLLCGTYHMDNPGLDEINVDADDPIESDRQRQLEELIDHFVDWRPELVAVERPYRRRTTVNEIYDGYRRGDRRYDREEEIDPPHPHRDDPTSECRSEVVQIGFRLADRLDHDHVAPIDYPMDLSNEALEALERRGVDPEPKVPAALPDLDGEEAALSARLRESSLVEYFRWLNREERQRVNRAMFGRYIRRGRADNYGGPLALARWYDRNLRMVHHLWRWLEDDHERLFVLVGNGHVRILRHLLAETPQFCPRPVGPLLRD